MLYALVSLRIRKNFHRYLPEKGEIRIQSEKKVGNVKKYF
jgi:hypothetical protein